MTEPQPPVPSSPITSAPPEEEVNVNIFNYKDVVNQINLNMNRNHNQKHQLTHKK